MSKSPKTKRGKIYGFCSSGNSSKGPHKDYSLSSSDETRIFGIFNAMPIIAITYGNGIIPEIQATLAPPVKASMLPFFEDIMALIGAFGFIPFFGDILAIEVTTIVAA
nr:GABA transporter 1 [Tanacetum cinerariifolium]